MRVDDFTYDLPERLIAQHPPKARGQSRLMVLKRSDDYIEHRHYGDLPDYLLPGDIVVLNDTKVIKARLAATTEQGNSRELLLIEKHGHDDNWHLHRCLYRGKLRTGQRLRVGESELSVEKLYTDGIALIRSEEDLLRIAERHGSVPLPPYMKREATASDEERYQTIFANNAGSVAAPTASLNLTEDILTKLRSKNIDVVYLTLHVGLGTFLPVRTEDVESHRMHSEYFEIPEDTVRMIRKTKRNGGKVVAIGTTVARTLEFAQKQILEQKSENISGEADIFIYPGFEFKILDGLVTNFHAPKTTVLMLAAAFAGWQNLEQAYREAIKERYAFLSYGDSMLII